MSNFLSFQRLVECLNSFWIEKDCLIIPPYSLEVGAGTLHPATALFPLTRKNWNTAYIQESRRPGDGRFGNHPNRLLRYFQYQVIMKPSPIDFRKIYLESLQRIGIDIFSIDIRFVEDNWENPTLGASGLGWEVWINGMEVTQFTYFQKLCGIRITENIPGEITYGLERIALVVQKKSAIGDIIFDEAETKYSDVFFEWERDNCKFISDAKISDLNFLIEKANQIITNDSDLVYSSYEICLKAIHLFNILNAKRLFSTLERAKIIETISNVVKKCAIAYQNLGKNHEK